jgi:hypothetical protein
VRLRRCTTRVSIAAILVLAGPVDYATGQTNKAKVERDKARFNFHTIEARRASDNPRSSSDIAPASALALESIELPHKSNQLIKALKALSAENHWDKRFHRW